MECMNAPMFHGVSPRATLALGLALLLVAVLAGCRGVPQRPAPVDGGDGGGPFATVEHGEVRSSTGCAIAYDLYRPQEPATDAVVVLGHGFLRSREHMAGLAHAIAAAGISTAALDFCNMRFWDGNHLQNGKDMITLARHLAGRREGREAVYAGFSAGGLAAVVAGRQDADAVGVVVLDLVDRDKIGVAAASGLDKPLIGLVGEPSACNADNNGLAVLAVHPRSEIIPVPGASHCDFETPTDGLCRLICESGADSGESSPRPRIVALTTRAVAALLGVGTALEATPGGSGDAAATDGP